MVARVETGNIPSAVAPGPCPSSVGPGSRTHGKRSRQRGATHTRTSRVSTSSTNGMGATHTHVTGSRQARPTDGRDHLRWSSLSRPRKTIPPTRRDTHARHGVSTSSTNGWARTAGQVARSRPTGGRRPGYEMTEASAVAAASGAAGVSEELTGAGVSSSATAASDSAAAVMRLAMPLKITPWNGRSENQ